MKRLHGTELDRASLIRRVGRHEQAFGVRLVTLGGVGTGVASGHDKGGNVKIGEKIVPAKGVRRGDLILKEKRRFS